MLQPGPVLCILFSSILFIFPLLLPAEETLTITTYYPSPYGSYRELTTTGNTSLATVSGNVGIGTANATATLHIVGDPEIKLESDNTPNHYPDIHFNSTRPTGRHYVIGNYGPDLANASLRNCFFIRDNAGADRLLIDPSGNVSLGSSTPTNKLIVAGLPAYADNTAAIAAGLDIGAFYRCNDQVCVVH